jgi:hypothetical protein
LKVPWVRRQKRESVVKACCGDQEVDIADQLIAAAKQRPMLAKEATDCVIDG